MTTEHGDDPMSPRPEESEFEARRLTGERGSIYRVELSRFPELLDPRAVVIQGREFIGQMVDTFYETGETVSPYVVQDTKRRTREKPELYRDIMETGAYSFTDEELRAGLVERPQQTLWMQVPDAYIARLSLPAGDPQKVDIVDDGTKKYWLVDGQRMPFADNGELMRRTKGEKAESNRFYVGVESRGVSKEDARRNREVLAHSIEGVGVILEAWDNLIQKTHEQDLFADSDENYVKQKFLRIGKVIMRARYYAEIFRAPETREGLAPAGAKLEQAVLAWQDLLQNRAVVEIEIPNPNKPEETIKAKRVMPNAHAYAKNWGMRELNTEYVQSRVAQQFAGERAPEGVDHQHFRHVRDKDNRRIARQAAILVDHFDLDAAYPFDLVWERDASGKMRITSVVEEVAYVDSAKLTHPTARRVKERFGDVLVVSGIHDRRNAESRRDHPRASGSPVTLYTLPELSSDFLNVTSVEVVAFNKGDLEKRKTNREQQVRRKVIKVTIDQRAFGAKDPKEDKRVFYGTSDSRRWSYVRKAKEAGKKSDDDVWVYEVTGLGDNRIWDEVQAVVKVDGETTAFAREDILAITPVDSKGKTARELMADGVEKLEVAMGTTTNATEIPKGLLEFYAWAGIYGEFTREDFERQFAEYTDKDPAKLRSISKQLGVAVNQLANTHQLSRDTVAKLEEYLRISLMAGLAAAIIVGKDVKTGTRSEEQPTLIPLEARGKDNIFIPLKRAMLKAEFVKRKEGKLGNEPEWADKDEEGLFDFIVNSQNLGPMSPWDLAENGRRFFTDAQLEELRPLYSILFLPGSTRE